jgi:carbamoyl-phosphate synthase small subunit
MQTILLLEDGKIFEGEGFGAAGTVTGEVVFNTGMTGYQEILTDPSYKGQMVTMTYPHIGNTGVNPDDNESARPHAGALIVREYNPVPSSHRSSGTLDGYMKTHAVMGLHQIDTRELTRRIREKGSMMGILSSEGMPVAELKKRLDAHPKIIGRDLVKEVTSPAETTWKAAADQAWYYEKFGAPPRKHSVAAYDFGIKHNILRLLTGLGMEVTAFPASTPAEAVIERNFDGVFLSNGPGDPEAVVYAVEAVKKLAARKPVFGICLGHQILGLAFGARTYKLKFGHHGSNHPVKNPSGGVEITSQNHNFAVESGSAEKTGFEITHLNLNDGTVEGMRHRDLPAFSVQYHPEASPGPHDSLYLFREFMRMMDGEQRLSVIGDG